MWGGRASPPCRSTQTASSRAALWEQKFRDVIKTPRKELVSIRDSEHMYLGHEDEVADAVISFLKKHLD